MDIHYRPMTGQLKINTSMFKTLSDLLEKNGITPLEDEIEVFRLHTKQKFFSAGEALAKRGLKNSKIFFVNKGIVRTMIMEQQKEITLDFFSVAEFVSTNLSTAANGVAAFTIEALTAVEVLYWEPEDVLQFKNNMPVSELIEKFALSEVIKKQELRKISLLSQTALERYNALLKTNPSVIQQVPIKILASYFGITPESLSRIRKNIS